MACLSSRVSMDKVTLLSFLPLSKALPLFWEQLYEEGFGTWPVCGWGTLVRSGGKYLLTMIPVLTRVVKVRDASLSSHCASWKCLSSSFVHLPLQFLSPGGTYNFLHGIPNWLGYHRDSFKIKLKCLPYIDDQGLMPLLFLEPHQEWTLRAVRSQHWELLSAPHPHSPPQVTRKNSMKILWLARQIFLT